MSNPIVAEVTKATGGYAKGAELGFENEAKARKVLGDGNFKITRQQDGTPIEKPAPGKKADKEPAS